MGQKTAKGENDKWEREISDHDTYQARPSSLFPQSYHGPQIMIRQQQRKNTRQIKD
jgi:hypothetical protein